MELEEHTLPKKERLNGDKRIDKLFSEGEAFIAYPLRIVYLKRKLSDDPTITMMVSVSKKKFKRAVKRNRVKRLVREAFRLNKTEFQNLSEKYGFGLDIAFLYLKNELPSFVEIEKAIQKTVLTLNDRLEHEKCDL